MGQVDGSSGLGRLTGSGLATMATNSAHRPYSAKRSISTPRGIDQCQTTIIASWLRFRRRSVGALARGGALSALAIPDPARWPWPTFTVNVVGAFLVGYFWSDCPCRVIDAHCSFASCATD